MNRVSQVSDEPQFLNTPNKNKKSEKNIFSANTSSPKSPLELDQNLLGSVDH
jgi:hypothetical protein